MHDFNCNHPPPVFESRHYSKLAKELDNLRFVMPSFEWKPMVEALYIIFKRDNHLFNIEEFKTESGWSK